MPNSHTYDGLTLTKEGAHLRVENDELNYLFVNRSRSAFLREYRESVDRVRSRLGARRALLSPEEMTDKEFADVTQELTLRAMFFYVVNRMEVDVTEADSDHTQSTHVIWTFFCRKYGERSPDIPRLTSTLSGMSETEFEQWLVGWRRYLEK